MTDLLQAQNISVHYDQVLAVDQVSIRLQAGQIVTVIGANGAGKTSLMNAIMGNLPHGSKQQGQVFFDGKSIEKKITEKRVAQGLCLVPETRELFGSMTVEENLRLGGFRLFRQGQKDWLNYLHTIYELFPRLKERRTQRASTLSGGERQMLALGRALMGKPKLLMLDEPSLGLAPLVVKEIFQTILKLKQKGVSILLVEQNARAALQVADYGYVLEMGHVTLEGPALMLMNNDAVIESYLGFKNNK